MDNQSRFRGNEIELKQRNRQVGLDIDRDTIVPELYDMDLDYQMAVEGLIQRE